MAYARERAAIVAVGPARRGRRADDPDRRHEGPLARCSWRPASPSSPPPSSGVAASTAATPLSCPSRAVDTRVRRVIGSARATAGVLSRSERDLSGAESVAVRMAEPSVGGRLRSLRACPQAHPPRHRDARRAQRELPEPARARPDGRDRAIAAADRRGARHRGVRPLLGRRDAAAARVRRDDRRPFAWGKLGRKSLLTPKPFEFLEVVVGGDRAGRLDGRRSLHARRLGGAVLRRRRHGRAHARRRRGRRSRRATAPTTAAPPRTASRTSARPGRRCST